MLVKSSSHSGEYVGPFRAYVSPFVAVTGLMGSIFIVIIFAKENPRSRFSIYAISMAIANGLTLIANTVIDDFLGRGLYYITNQQFYFKLDTISEFWCKSVEYLSNTMYFVYSYLILAFSIDRLLTIYKPITFYSIYYKQCSIFMCTMILFVGIILNTPLIFIQTLVTDSESRTNFTCRMIDDLPLAKFSVAFEVLATFTFPVIIILTLNILICNKLWQLKHTRSQLLPTDQTRNRLEMGRVMGHLAVSTVFLSLYIPMVVVVLIRLYLTVVHMDRHSIYALRIIDLSRLFSSLKDITYAVNFFVYLIFLKNFRTRFRQLFCKS